MQNTVSNPQPRRPSSSAWNYTWKVGGLLVLLLAIVVGGLLFYASTDHFSQFVRQRVITVLEDATGGRVEMGRLQWNVRHLSVEVDDLTIHGLEGPGEMPYAHVSRLYARARILSFLKARLGLDFLEVDKPALHLIIYPDGHTNQPAPKAREKGYEPETRTLLDLQANRVEVHDGLALLNQRALPFQLAANHMNALVTFLPLNQHYLGEFTCADLSLQQGKGRVVRSQVALRVEAAGDAAELKELHFLSGKSSFSATGTVTHFANPQWKVSADGRLDLEDAADLGALDGLRRGTLDLSLAGGGVGASQFSLDGKASLKNGGYSIPYVVIEGLNATTHLHVTPTEITLPDLLAQPRDGGVVNASIRYTNWLEPALPPVSRAGKGAASLIPTMAMRTRVHGVRLSTIMHIFVTPGYQDIGYDTLGEGPVDIDWTGDASDFTIAANLKMSAPGYSAPGELPLTGMADAKYFQRRGVVTINQLQAHSPGTALSVSGSLGVYPTNLPSNISVHLVNQNLGEFDQVLKTLDLGVNGKKGISGVPIQLHGDATFDGIGEGSLEDPAFHGHVTAGRFSTALVVPAKAIHGAVGRQSSPPADGAQLEKPAANPFNVSWDHLDATGAYSSSLISIAQATVSRGKTVLHASGQLQAHRITRHRQVFDDDSPITADVQMQNASVSDLLSMTGQNLPMTGNMNLQAHAGGTVGNLNGGGELMVHGGAIAGQPYQSVVATVNLAGQDINLVKLTLLLNGGAVVMNGTYNRKAATFLANLDGANFDLAHFPQPKDPRLSLAGELKFDAHASGTLEAPSILAGVHMRNLVLGGQPAGGLEVTAHTQGNTAYFHAQNSLTSNRLQLIGQTVLEGDFRTQAELVLSGLDIAPFLRALKVQSVSGNSSIGGTVTVDGPLREPKRMNGEAQITQFAVTVQGIPLQAEGPLRASLHEGTLRLTQAHITGTDTDLSVSGTAELAGDQQLAVSGKGALNMKLAQTFDPDITSSGHLDFNIDAGGTLTRPFFSGRLHVTNVALALNDLPNGLSHLNGNLAFDQNRLTVQDLVGTTGGGQLKFGGFLAYQQGIYGDFTASGKDIRVRYSGISATADTTLHLQGSQNSMLLSGSVQITRFIIGPNVDFASFSTGPSATTPPDLNAPSSHVRLDVHIFSAPQLDFQNSYAQLSGSVDLRIRGTVAQPAILGRINITDGTANFAGTTYRLQHGQIFFTNPVTIQPIIDIDATTRIEEYDVTIGLHGSSNQLTPTFRSEPPLPQADVISLLALGRTQEEQQLYSQQEQSVGGDSTTTALLGGALNAAVGSRVQKLFGGGSVKIDPTYVGSIGNSSARITVQQNISRNVQVTYATNVNATAQQLIQAQVDVTSSVSVLAVRDEAGVFSMVLKVHKRYR